MILRSFWLRWRRRTLEKLESAHNMKKDKTNRVILAPARLYGRRRYTLIPLRDGVRIWLDVSDHSGALSSTNLHCSHIWSI